MNAALANTRTLLSEQYRWSFHYALPNFQDLSPRIAVNIAIPFAMFKVVKV
jgi:hypothetical protein